MTTSVARHRDRLRQSVAPFLSFFSGPFARLNLEPDVANFAVGNPQEMPLPAYVDALQRHAEPLDKDWFAYKFSEAEPRRIVAESLLRRTGIAYEPEDVAMTAGAFGGLGVSIRALCDEGDESSSSPPRGSSTS